MVFMFFHVYLWLDPAAYMPLVISIEILISDQPLKLTSFKIKNSSRFAQANPVFWILALLFLWRSMLSLPCAFPQKVLRLSIKSTSELKQIFKNIMTDVWKYRNKKKRLTLSVAYLQLSKMRTNTVKAINDAKYSTPKAHRDHWLQRYGS